MSNRRRAEINRNAAYEDEETPAPTLKDADAALYGALSRVDNKRKAIERTRFGAFKITPRGLEIGEGAQKQDWEEAGQFIFQVDKGIQWLIGDWLAYGEDVKWGDIPHIAKLMGKEEKTLYDLAYVARKVQFSVRTEKLTFTHHKLVAALTPSEQEEALAYAIEKNLPVSEFRKILRARTKAVHSLPALSEQDWSSSISDIQHFGSNPQMFRALPGEQRRQAILRLKKIVKFWESLDHD